MLPNMKQIDLDFTASTALLPVDLLTLVLISESGAA